MKHIQRGMDAECAIIVDDDDKVFENEIHHDPDVNILVKNGDEQTLTDLSLHQFSFNMPLLGGEMNGLEPLLCASSMRKGVKKPLMNLYQFQSFLDDTLSCDKEKDVSGMEKCEGVKVSKKTKITPLFLKKIFFEDSNIMEIGVDEAGRGPLFGRVYTAAVILPKDPDLFDHTLMKDSKKFHSKKKIEEVAKYIKEKAIEWSVTYEDEKSIDDINILQATQKSMHHSITNVIEKQTHHTSVSLPGKSFYLLIDGNYFNPLTIYNKNSKKIEVIPHICIEGGDNQYASIAAASILAKVERDRYIDDLCKEYPELGDKYGIDTNKGYGAKKHLDGIQKYGITEWHRKTFGICKNFA